MRQQNTRAGIALMSLTSLIFSLQDVITRHLAAEYNVALIVMLRFWFFAFFVMAFAARSAGGIRGAVATRQPGVQIFRGVLLAFEIGVMGFAFVKLGLVESHAVFTCYPLLVAALSGPVLGEQVGWRRWTAIAIGLVGVLIILQPGVHVFSPYALVPLLAALCFALYGLLTRYVARKDSATVSFFWAGIAGAVASTPVGLMHWQPMTASDWGWMTLLCVMAASAHFSMIKALELAEASAIQPFAYLQLVFVSILGVVVYQESLRTNVVIGAAIVVSTGLFTLWRARLTGRAAPPVTD